MPEIQFSTARTTAADPTVAAGEICAALPAAPVLVTVFGSYHRDHLALNRALRERLPRSTRILGASTGGEIDRAGMHQGSVVAAALSGDLEVGLGLGRGLSRDAIGAGAEAMRAAAAELGVAAADLDRERHVGMVIDDGFRLKKEELLIGMLGDNPDITLVGGGANADDFDPTTRSPVLHLDGEVASDATLLCLISTRVPFAATRTHSYLPTGQRITITRIDETCTRALEIDGQPAATRYAALIGTGIDELTFGTANGFAAHPTAVKMGREYVLRAPWKPLPDGSIVFANLLEEGNELELMRDAGIVETTRRFLTEELPARVGGRAAGALFFHCSARSWYAMNTGKLPALSAAFAEGPPCAGFNVAFEIYNGLHVNTTLTALAFGATP